MIVSFRSPSPDSLFVFTWPCTPFLCHLTQSMGTFPRIRISALTENNLGRKIEPETASGEQPGGDLVSEETSARTWPAASYSRSTLRLT